MAYRPQAYETAERMVRTFTRVPKRYDTDFDQRDKDECTVRLTFLIEPLKTAYVETRLLIHEWDPISPVEAALSLNSTKLQDQDPPK